MGLKLVHSSDPFHIPDVEIEFKAAWYHERWIEKKQRDGYHHPDVFHNNPRLVPPPLRDDGRTRCDQCHLQMVSWRELPEKYKPTAREIVRNIPKCNDAWRKSNG